MGRGGGAAVRLLVVVEGAPCGPRHRAPPPDARLVATVVAAVAARAMPAPVPAAAAAAPAAAAHACRRVGVRVRVRVRVRARVRVRVSLLLQRRALLLDLLDLPNGLELRALRRLSNGLGVRLLPAHLLARRLQLVLEPVRGRGALAQLCRLRLVRVRLRVRVRVRVWVEVRVRVRVLIRVRVRVRVAASASSSAVRSLCWRSCCLSCRLAWCPSISASLSRICRSRSASADSRVARPTSLELGLGLG